ncbi:hypothetical protein M407DRAFT_31947 [Tulasnella calospora MUT 4182]|uniref:F-box domain-containing protein n=1 Tax=Tulasnella calospora MUT 4182 TaxID=1051891 RepID=A0A0C3LAD4_9AGAM|nr:hypothetical protein M407DRAFT_31947 [Tulasnella calospora MUT 4182]
MHPTTVDAPTEFASSTSSVYALPPEIFTDIFRHLYTDPSIPRRAHDLRSTHKLTFVMLVCKAWNDIVERAPILWTDIWLGRCPPYIGNEDTRQWLDHIKTRFERSGTLPLNLTIMARHVDLEEVSHLLLQHISRCKTLALRAIKDETHLMPISQSNTPSVIYHILSSPLPMLQKITIGGFVLGLGSEDRCEALELDAPNLREITTLSADIVQFIRPQSPLLCIHDSLEPLSISPDW